MTETAYSAAFRADLVQQAIRTDASAASLGARFGVPSALVQDWLRQAADAIPALFAATPAAGTSDQHFRTLFETATDAIMLLTETGFFNCNPSTLSIYGVATMQDFIKLHPADLSPPTQPDGTDSFAAANAHIARAIQTGSDHFEWMHRRRSGEDFEADVLLSCFMEDGRPVLQATVRDISRMKRLQAALAASHAELALAHAAVERKNRELELLCVTDQLTGLFNRRRLDEVIRTECQAARRYRAPVAMILADIDHFKHINDNFGHQAGDSVLRRMAALMQQNLRETDVLGRWGGEEFMVVCRGTHAAEARVLAERMRHAIQIQSFDPAGFTTCSFGVAAFDSVQGAEAMIRKADDALYRAKAAGRNRVVVGNSLDAARA